MPTQTRQPADRLAARAVAPRRDLPQTRTLRLPGGYYDPDSCAFADVRPSDLDELIGSTTPVEPARLALPARS
ncbi:MAG TPA: hypothetical protein VH723_03250 [Candidatus Limnocylindrales bacterium]|jgi:hypothetical protein